MRKPLSIRTIPLKVKSKGNYNQKGISRRIRRLAGVLIALVLLFAGCSLVTNHLVQRADQTALRDPETGILIGAEERDLGPADATGAILMVHGFVGGSNNFNTVPDILAEHGWHVRVMRLPGHGTSPLDFEEVSADELTDAVHAELIKLKETYSTVVLAGHSMGGALSTIAAAEDNPDRLVLAAPYYGVTYHWYYILKPESWNRVLHPFIRWVYKGELFKQVNREEVKNSIVSYAWIPTHGLQILDEIGKQARQPETLERIHCPILLLHSINDVAASFTEAQRAFKIIPAEQKKAVWLEKSNHQIFWDYENGQVAEEIVQFIGEPPERAEITQK